MLNSELGNVHEWGAGTDGSFNRTTMWYGMRWKFLLSRYALISMTIYVSKQLTVVSAPPEL